MIALHNTTDTLELATSSTSAIKVVVTYVDRTLQGGGSAIAGRQVTSISSATTTAILAAPPIGYVREVRMITVRNTGAATNIATLKLDANTTEYEMYSVSLEGSESFAYLAEVGFTKFSAANLDVWKYVTADSVHATAATFADVTGLTQALLSGKIYAIEAILFSANDASTTGSQFAYNIDDAPTFALFGEVGAVTNSVTAGAVGIGTATARDTAIVAQTTGQTATGMHHIAGVIQPSADGTFAIRATSEVTVAAGLTVKKGSWLHIHQVA